MPVQRNLYQTAHAELVVPKGAAGQPPACYAEVAVARGSFDRLRMSGTAVTQILRGHFYGFQPISATLAERGTSVTASLIVTLSPGASADLGGRTTHS